MTKEILNKNLIKKNREREMRSIILCLILAVVVQQSQSAPMLEEKKGLGQLLQSLTMMDKEEGPSIPELDYNSVKFENVELKVEEIEMEPSEFFAKVLACIEKCAKDMPTNAYRDKCLAKTCDIYKKK